MSEQQTNVEKYEFEPIKGYPMLKWQGKRPFRSTQYFPAQLKEVYGQEDNSGWINKIFWGDNLQVMSHLLKEFRGKIDLIYIDPPFDSKADYKRNIKLKGKSLASDSSSFEDKQYTDIWSNDEYLQFIYERIVLCRELLSDKGSIYVHCDWHVSHYIRLILDEVMGPSNHQNEIVWCYSGWNKKNKTYFNKRHDNIFYYSKTEDCYFEPYKLKWESEEEYVKQRKQKVHLDKEGRKFVYSDAGNGKRIARFLDEAMADGRNIDDVWRIDKLNNSDKSKTGYPTQKPNYLLERIITSSSPEEGIVFDCFMGSGTTQAVANKLNRRFIGADINLGAIQTTTKRLATANASFEVYNVNNYEIFRNPVEAKELLIEALEVQKLESSSVYDGEKDGYKVKIMPVNRIATKEDLNELIANFPYKQFEARKEANPNQPVEEIMLVCMGHEPSLGATLENESGYKLKVQVVDILRDKSDLTFKYDSEAAIKIEGNKLVVEAFYPRNLLQKLSQQKDDVEEWREMVESIMIDWNFDGAVMEPVVIDIPPKDEFVVGEYEIPEGASNIKVKITDLLSESYEEVIVHG